MSDWVITGFKSGVLGKVIEMHGLYYSQYQNIGLPFEAKVAEVLAQFALRFNPERDGFWAVWDGERFVGTISIDGVDGDTKGARLRAFIIDPAYQGRGIGHTLMNLALDFCDKAGYKRIYLTTITGLDAAHHLYVKYGFKLIHEEEDNSWGMVLTEQEWERVC